MSNQQEYRHKSIILKCCIEANELKKDEVTVRLLSENDWKKNLQFILSRILVKFKFLLNMHASEWSLCINDKIIDTNDPINFGKLLSTIPPIPVIQIISKTNSSNNCTITVHYNNQYLDHKITSDFETWNNNTYLSLIEAIRKQFDLNTDVNINLYEDIDGNKIDVDDMDDIAAAFYNDYDDEDDAPKQIQLYVEVEIMEQKLMIDSDSSEEYDDEFEKKTETIAKKLIQLGNCVGYFTENKKALCHNLLNDILNEAKSNDDRSTIIQNIVTSVTTESEQFIRCILMFLRMIGYSASHCNEGFKVSGQPIQNALNEIICNFYQFTNLMQKPRQNIYQQLNIKIPNEANVIKHETGINDNKFIIFKLAEILLENQQSDRKST
eukprot:58621_1